MAEECLGDRRRILEEEFFRKQEQAVLNQLRTAQAQQSPHEALAVATGVRVLLCSTSSARLGLRLTRSSLWASAGVI